LQLDLQGGPQP
jgi:hypothetical protein